MLIFYKQYIYCFRKLCCKHLLKCPNIYIPARNIIVLPHKYFGVPRKFICCTKIFSNLRKHFISPLILLCFMCRFLGSFLSGNAMFAVII